MTREMKLGLLVTLAFVIVIGVLLSDFAQQRAQPARADLVGSSANVRKGIAGPDSKNAGTVVVVPPANVEPGTVVATNDSVTQEKNAGPEISIGPAAPTLGNGPKLATMAFGSDKTDVTPPIGGGSNINVLPPTPGNNAGTPTNPNLTSNTLVKPTVPTKTYTAVEGDTITKIAKKMYGTWTTANGELILKANPSMGPEGKKIKIGGKYQIPALPGTAAPSATPPAPITGAPVLAGNLNTGSAPTTPVVPTNTPAPKPAKTLASGKTYTVKDGDTLSKIATKQAGGHLAELVELNKDVLKDGKYLKIGTVLKLPTTQVATAD